MSTDPPELTSLAQPLADLLARGAASRDLESIGRAHRIFVNRNLRMEEIQLIGFDMDYTLAIYHQAEMERLSIELTLAKLVEQRGYPAAISKLDYDPAWAIRGLVVDHSTGNVCKMDRHGYVGRVFHGATMLSREARTALYRQERIRLSSPRYAWIDTLFALPEAVMYLKLVEFFEQGASAAARVKAPDPERLWRDVRECIDEAHRDDSLKSVIKADLARFVAVDPELPATLHKLRSSGKRLFVLTNSLWDYTDAVMRFLLDGKLPAYPSWRNYFDMVVVGGAKPAFFTDRNPFVEIDALGGNAQAHKVSALLRNHVYQAGNLVEFEEMAGTRGDRVLYIGDHIYGDILRAKKSSVWRTCMIVQELEQELKVSETLAERLRLLDELDRRRRNLDAEVDYQNLVLKGLQRLPAAEGEGAVEPGVPIDLAKKKTKAALDAVRAALREATKRYDDLENEIDMSFNKHWGPIFKEGNENSRFGEQVEDYACLYTSRVSNFLEYSPLRYFRAPRDKMPHEI